MYPDRSDPAFTAPCPEAAAYLSAGRDRRLRAELRRSVLRSCAVEHRCSCMTREGIPSSLKASSGVAVRFLGLGLGSTGGQLVSSR